MLRRFRRREYSPDAPLYARQAMQLRGVKIAVGQVIPADLVTPRKRKQLWMSRKADHAPPKGKSAALPSPEVAMPPTAHLLTRDLNTLTPDELAELEAATAGPLQTANAAVSPGQVA